MSLVQHLYRPGPLRTWWAERTAGLLPYAEQLGELAARSHRLQLGGAEHAAQVGGIVGRLLETIVEPAPPYAAILGGGVRADAALWPTHARLKGEQHHAAVEYRPTPRGLQRLVPAGDRGYWSAAIQRVAEIESESNHPLELARAAGVVSSLEAAYRAGGGKIERVRDEAIEDSAAIVTRMSASFDVAERLCQGRIGGHAAPTFAPHWADGDILLGPGRSGGYGLIDVKTVGASTLRDPRKVCAWLAQLLSYVACDVDEDLWQVRAVGIWLPRQDALLAWPVRELRAAARIDAAELARLALILQTAYSRDAGKI